MIKFFRQTRQRLLTENRFSKYLLYAIGEVVLVVIGILIALQVNTWNEFRKDRIKENQILIDLKKSLNADIENQLNPNISQIVEDLSNVNSIIKSLENKAIYNDSMSIKFRSLMFSKSFKWEVTTYKSLENEGLNIISKPELKSEILRLYNMKYPELEYFISNFSKNLIEFFRPEMREKFKFNYKTTNEIFYVPSNYEELLHDTSFMNTLLTARLNFQNIYNSLKETKLDVGKVIANIDNELAN